MPTLSNSVNPHTHLASDIVGSLPPSSSFVYRPGEPNPGNGVYADFNELYSALIQVSGNRSILFDDDLISPCYIPPKNGGGSYNFRNVALTGSSSGNDTPDLTVSVRFLDDTTVSDFGASSFLITFESVSSSPIMEVSDGAFHLVICEYGTQFVSNGLAPFFSVSSGGIILVGQAGVNLLAGAAPILHLSGIGAIGQVNLWDSSTLGPGTLSSVVGSLSAVIYDASCQVSGTQPAVLGSLNLALQDAASQVLYNAGGSPYWVPPAPTNTQEALDRLAAFAQAVDAQLGVAGVLGFPLGPIP